MLKTGDVARRIGVSKVTIINWCEKGIIKCKRLPTGARIFTEEEIERLVDMLKDDEPDE